MRLIVAVIVAMLAAAPAHAAAQYAGVTDTSTQTAEQRVMHLSIIVAAPRAVLFRALTDADELKRWNTPVAFVDVRPGGTMETSYDRTAVRGDPNNIKNEFVAVEPDRLLVFRNIQAPPGLPGRERFGHIVSTIRFEDAGPAATRVDFWQVGYGGGEADRPLWAFFRSGNAYVLAQMNHVYGKGPKPQMPDGH